MHKIIQFILLAGSLAVLANSLQAQSPIEDYDASKTYSIGSLVLNGQDAYIAISAVPVATSPPNTSYWTNLSVVATALSIPMETVPTLSTETILNSLPGPAPSDGNHSSFISAYKLNMNYATGSLVILEQKSYVALQPVPANGTWPTTSGRTRTVPGRTLGYSSVMVAKTFGLRSVWASWPAD